MSITRLYCKATLHAHTLMASPHGILSHSQPGDHIVVVQRVHEDFCIKIVGVNESSSVGARREGWTQLVFEGRGLRAEGRGQRANNELSE